MAGANSSRPGRHTARPGGNRPRTHPSRIPAPTLARSARPGVREASGNSPAEPRREPTASKPPRIPVAIELAIDEQRKSIEAAISLLYCLHSALHREVDDGGMLESEAVENASNLAHLTYITAMLLVRLSSIHTALDAVELMQAKVDPENLRISDLARELTENDEGEPS